MTAILIVVTPVHRRRPCDDGSCIGGERHRRSDVGKHAKEQDEHVGGDQRHAQIFQGRSRQNGQQLWTAPIPD